MRALEREHIRAAAAEGGAAAGACRSQGWQGGAHALYGLAQPAVSAHLDALLDCLSKLRQRVPNARRQLLQRWQGGLAAAVAALRLRMQAGLQARCRPQRGRDCAQHHGVQHTLLRRRIHRPPDVVRALEPGRRARGGRREGLRPCCCTSE